jgi:integrase
MRGAGRHVKAALTSAMMLASQTQDPTAAQSPTAVLKKEASSSAQPMAFCKSFRLLRSVLNTAVADRLIAKNPCQIPGAGQEKSPERPTATVEQVFTIAAAMPGRYRLLDLLGCFNSLRWGELTALARQHVDPVEGTVLVERSVVERTGELVFGPPKSEASVRVVTVPSIVLSDVVHHLKEFTKPGKTALLFAGSTGAPLRRSNFQEHWRKATTAAGVPHLHFHDLRHTGNTWAAESGATLRDLMDRMGHSTTRAALLYLHKTAGRDRKTSRPVRLVIVTRPPLVSTIARTPSHLNSNAQPDPDGTAPAVASIGNTGLASGDGSPTA